MRSLLDIDIKNSEWIYLNLALGQLKNRAVSWLNVSIWTTKVDSLYDAKTFIKLNTGAYRD